MIFNEDIFVKFLKDEGRKLITVLLTAKERQELLQFLSMQQNDLKLMFSDSDQYVMFSQVSNGHTILVIAYPDRMHIVSNGFCYIGVYFVDHKGILEYRNKFWLSLDEYDALANVIARVDCKNALNVFDTIRQKFDSYDVSFVLDKEE